MRSSKSLIGNLLFLVFPFSIFAQEIYVEPVGKAVLQQYPFYAVSFSPKGNFIALSGTGKTIKVVDPFTLSERYSLATKSGGIFGLAFAPSGTSLIASTANGKIMIWGIPDTSQVEEIEAHVAALGVRAIDVSMSGKMISGGSDHETKLWQGGNAIGSFPKSDGEVLALAFTPDGKYAASGTSDGYIQILDIATLTVSKKFSTSSLVQMNTLRFSPDGKFLAAAFADSTVRMWGIPNYTPLQYLKSRSGIVSSLSYSADNLWLATASNVIQCWNLKTRTLATTISDSADSFNLVAFSPVSPVLVATTVHGAVKTYRVLSEKPDTIPPQVVVEHPRTKENEVFKIYAPQIDVACIASDENDVKEATIGNDKFILIDAGATGKLKSKRFSATVKLPTIGMNNIIVTATDKRGNTAVSHIQIQRFSKDAALEILSPKEVFETDQVSTDLDFRVWFDYVRYIVTLNTVEIINKENSVRGIIGAESKEKIFLSAGFNQLVLTVSAKNGEKITKSFDITRRTLNASVAPNPDVVRRTSNQPEQWAVVVGISEYQNPQIKNLKFADRDAKEFADFLKTPAGGGFESAHMQILLNKDATLRNIKEALYNFLRQTIENDLVIIYFAGHGASEPANTNNNYLLAYDTDPNSLETTAFPMWDVSTALTRYIPSKRVVVFSDACHSGGISSDLATRGMSLSETNLINQYLSDLSKAKEGTIVFTASQAGEVSQELEKYGHGVFTYFLLEGMKGAADINNDYTVTIGELMDYVEEKVKRETNGNQHPTRNQGNYDKDMTISLVAH